MNLKKSILTMALMELTFSSYAAVEQMNVRREVPFLFMLIFFNFMSTFAISVHDAHVYSIFNSSRQISIHSVISENDTTLVRILVKGEPGTVFEIPADFRIIDAAGFEYDNVINVNNKICFSLDGESLHDIAFITPHGIKWPFDLVAGINRYREYGIFGVDTVKAEHSSSVPVELHDERCKSDKNVSVLYGRVSHPTRADYVSLMYKSLGTEHDFSHRFPIAAINEDGIFRLSIDNTSPVWNYLKIGDDIIPFFAVPNDSLYININYIDSCSSRISCKYRSHDAGVQRFLNADVFGAWVSDYLFTSPNMNVDDMIDTTESMKNRLFMLCSYLINKHGLDACQAHHMMNRIRLHVAVARLRFINSKIDAILVNSKRNKLNVTDKEKMRFVSVYDFVKDFNVDDPCLYVQQEYPMFLNQLNTSYLVRSLQNEDLSSIYCFWKAFFSGKDVAKLIADLEEERKGAVYLGYEAKRGRKIECKALSSIIKEYLGMTVHVTLCHSEEDLAKMLSNIDICQKTKSLILIPSVLKGSGMLSELRTIHDTRLLEEDTFRAIREWLRVGTMPYTIEINKEGNMAGY